MNGKPLQTKIQKKFPKRKKKIPKQFSTLFEFQLNFQSLPSGATSTHFKPESQKRKCRSGRSKKGIPNVMRWWARLDTSYAKQAMYKDGQSFKTEMVLRPVPLLRNSQDVIDMVAASLNRTRREFVVPHDVLPNCFSATLTPSNSGNTCCFSHVSKHAFEMFVLWGVELFHRLLMSGLALEPRKGQISESKFHSLAQPCLYFSDSLKFFDPNGQGAFADSAVDLCRMDPALPDALRSSLILDLMVAS